MPAPTPFLLPTRRAEADAPSRDDASRDGFFCPHLVNVLTTRLGRANVVVSLWMLAGGLIMGAVLGLWSFDGPLPPPPGLASYDSFSRRLLRLAHIAAIALPILNLHLLPWLDWSVASARVKTWSYRLLLTGTLLLPPLLAVTAFCPPVKYALPLPVTCLITTSVILAVEATRRIAIPSAGNF